MSRTLPAYQQTDAPTLDLDGPLHLERKLVGRYRIVETQTMVSPQIEMQEWGIAVGTFPSNDDQELESLTLSAINARCHKTKRRDLLGNPFWIVSVPVTRDELRTTVTVKIESTVKLSARTLRAGAPSVPPELSRADIRKFVRWPNPEDTAAIRRWLAEKELRRGANERDVVYASRVLATMKKSLRYRWNSSEERGLGVCLRRGYGACGDLNTTAVLALRTAGIPARLLMGRNIIGERRPLSPQEDGTLHVAAEFWAEGIGWTPIEGSTFKGDSLATGGELTPFLGQSFGSFAFKHFDYAYVDNTPRALQICDFPFGTWTGKWDGWQATGSLGFEKIP